MNNADFVVLLKAMADETRLKIMAMLKDGELCACKMLENVDITQPTLSYHMKILCESGLVDGRKDGAWMRYTINSACLDRLLSFFDALTPLCCEKGCCAEKYGKGESD